MRSYPKNPLQQRVKGVLVFKIGLDDCIQKANELLKALQCDVLASRGNRITISTSRKNMQSIKACWESKDPDSNLSVQLNEHIVQMIIGGNL